MSENRALSEELLELLDHQRTVRAPRLDSGQPDVRDPLHRMGLLLDAGSMRPLPAALDDGVGVAIGRIDGAPVVVYCTDGSRMGGAIGAAECPHIADAIDLAARER